jgi:hypothetical protein
MSTEEEIADLKRQLAEVKDAMRAAQPKPKPSREEEERATAEWRDKMHQAAERRANSWTPPSVHQYFADGVTAADCADLRQQAHRPIGRPGMIPEQPTSGGSPRPTAGDGTGWIDPVPVGVAGGTRTQELIERMTNAALPHGPEWGKGKK